jgi:DNA-binding LacI/PurR family transcriptional regulator
MSKRADAPAASGARPTSGPRRPRGTDVARLAGVSQKTVSRVMNAEAHVKEDVRLRVLAAARELGYRRNNLARALNSGRTNRIGVVSLGTALFGPSSMLIAIERAARGMGFALSVINTFEGDPGGVSGAIESLLDEGVDGIVLSEPIDEGPVPLALDVPVLTLGQFPGLSAPSIITAGVEGDLAAYAATRYLISVGHTEIRHLAGPQRWWSSRDRLQGWVRAMDEAALPTPKPIHGDWSPASGYNAGRRLVLDRAMTAVFAANDDMAIGLIRALAEGGRRVPQDVSVIGFDDIPSAAYVNPPLSTIAQEFDSIAVRALKRLMTQVRDRDGPDVDVVDDSTPARLIIRESTSAILTGARQTSVHPLH